VSERISTPCFVFCGGWPSASGRATTSPNAASDSGTTVNRIVDGLGSNWLVISSAFDHLTQCPVAVSPPGLIISRGKRFEISNIFAIYQPTGLTLRVILLSVI
jgi:hypothetical protein